MKSQSGYLGVIGVFVSLLAFEGLTSCSDGKPAVKKEQAISIGMRDSTMLFDGKSLDGWEITNFGPQGPVTVSGNQIILGMGEGCTGITWKKAFPEADMRYPLMQKGLRELIFSADLHFLSGRIPVH